MKPLTRFVLEMLLRGPACPRRFTQADIYEYRARIYELRQAGVGIGRRRCTNPEHHHVRRIDEYYLQTPIRATLGLDGRPTVIYVGALTVPITREMEGMEVRV